LFRGGLVLLLPLFFCFHLDCHYFLLTCGSDRTIGSSVPVTVTVVGCPARKRCNHNYPEYESLTNQSQMNMYCVNMFILKHIFEGKHINTFSGLYMESLRAFLVDGPRGPLCSCLFSLCQRIKLNNRKPSVHHRTTQVRMCSDAHVGSYIAIHRYV